MHSFAFEKPETVITKGGGSFELVFVLVALILHCVKLGLITCYTNDEVHKIKRLTIVIVILWSNIYTYVLYSITPPPMLCELFMFGA